MDAAAIGLEEDDLDEALDAQAFVVESLQNFVKRWTSTPVSLSLKSTSFSMKTSPKLLC